MRINRSEAAQDVVVMLGLVLVIVLISWVYKASPYLVTGTFSATNSRILTIGVTIEAQIFSSFVSSQIQKGLMRSLEDPLRSIQDEPHLIMNSRFPVDDYDREVIQKLDKNRRSILKVDSVVEKIRNYPIFSLYLFSSLTTTSIVATFTATIAAQQVFHRDVFLDTSFGIYSDDKNRSCFGIYEPPFNYGTHLRAAFQWSVENGSKITSLATGQAAAGHLHLSAL
ncbi:hypothetical protein GGR58DRAFT_522155 [Xylaria digitata]|nr:hypothetical protein GGR58DRAFT_522155 [Xylaria digitata]